MESFEEIGQRLNQAHSAFDEARGRLVDKRGNVIKRTEGLKQLGAKVKKELDRNILQEAEYNHEQASLISVDSNEE